MPASLILEISPHVRLLEVLENASKKFVNSFLSLMTASWPIADE